MPSHKKADPKQKKISAMFQPIASPAPERIEAKKKHEEFSAPVRFCEFVENTNVFDIAIDEIMLLYPEDYEKHLKDTKPMIKIAKTIFKRFYSDIKSRELTPQNKIVLKEDSPTEFRDNYLKIIHASNEQPQKRKKIVTFQCEDVSMGAGTSKDATNQQNQQNLQKPTENTKTVPLKLRHLTSQMRSEISKLIEKDTCQTNEHKTNYPVPLSTFKRFTYNDHIVDEILRSTHAHRYERDAKMRALVLKNFYVAFYERPSIRDIFSLKLKPCPAILRDKILSLPKGHLENADTGATENDVILETEAENAKIAHDDDDDALLQAETIEKVDSWLDAHLDEKMAEIHADAENVEDNVVTVERLDSSNAHLDEQMAEIHADAENVEDNVATNVVEIINAEPQDDVHETQTLCCTDDRAIHSPPMKRQKLQQECTSNATEGSEMQESITVDAEQHSLSSITNQACRDSQVEMNYVLAARENVMLRAAGNKRRISTNETKLPVTLSEFIKYTNILLLVKAQLDALELQSHETHLMHTDLFTAIVNELYLKFYLEPNCRGRCVFQLLMIKAAAPCRILQIPTALQSNENDIHQQQQREKFEQQPSILPEAPSSTVLEHVLQQQPDTLAVQLEALEKSDPNNLAIQQIETLSQQQTEMEESTHKIVSQQTSILLEQQQPTFINQQHKTLKSQQKELEQIVVYDSQQTEVLETQQNELEQQISVVEPQPIDVLEELHTALSQPASKNKNAAIENCIASAFLHPVENLQHYESYLPVTLNVFKTNSYFDEIIDNILLNIEDAGKRQQFSEDSTARECIIQHYYTNFYMQPGIRNAYKLRLKLCPKFLKDKILEIPDTKKIRELKEFLDTLKDVELAKTQILTQQTPLKQQEAQNLAVPRPKEKEVRKLLHLSVIQKEAFLKHHLSQKLTDSNKMLQLLARVQNQFTKLHKNDINIYSHHDHIYSKKNGGGINIQSVLITKPKDIEVAKPVESVAPPAKLPDSKNSETEYRVALRLEAAEKLFFQRKFKKKYHKLAYIVRCCSGLKQRILCAVLEMSLDEFTTYTHVYNAAEWKTDLAMQQRLYNYAIVEPQVWPVNLFMRLQDLLAFLETKNIKLKQLELSVISPKLLHWLELSTATNFDYCARLDYYKSHAKWIPQSAEVKLNSCRIAYYKKCWTQEQWLWQTPIVNEPKLTTKLNAVQDICDEIEEHLGPALQAPDLSQFTLLKKVIVTKCASQVVLTQQSLTGSMLQADNELSPENTISNESAGVHSNTSQQIPQATARTIESICAVEENAATEMPAQKQLHTKTIVKHNDIKTSPSQQIPQAIARTMENMLSAENNIITQVFQFPAIPAGNTQQSQSQTQLLPPSPNLFTPSGSSSSTQPETPSHDCNKVASPSSNTTSTLHGNIFVEFPNTQTQIEMLPVETNIFADIPDMPTIKLEAQEVQNLNKLQFNLIEETDEFECVPIPETVVNLIDDDDHFQLFREKHFMALYSDTSQPKGKPLTLSELDFDVSNTATICEGQQLLSYMELDEMSNSPEIANTETVSSAQQQLSFMETDERGNSPELVEKLVELINEEAAIGVATKDSTSTFSVLPPKKTYSKTKIPKKIPNELVPQRTHEFRALPLQKNTKR